MRKGRSGFTLIELLVVIAIIAILAAILFPVFARAKKRAQESVCISNLKQIGGALQLYLQDSHDRYPATYAYIGDLPANQIDATDPSAVGLLHQLLRYSRTARIWTCPSGAVRPRGAAVCSAPAGLNYALVGWARVSQQDWMCTNYVTYPLNGSNPNTACYCRGWTPAEAIAKWGRAFSPGGPMYSSYPNPVWNNRLIQDGYTVGNLWRPHRAGTNILYHDGHVARAQDFRDGGRDG